MERPRPVYVSPERSVLREYEEAAADGYTDAIRSGHPTPPRGSELEQSAYGQGWQEGLAAVARWESMPLAALEAEYEGAPLTLDEQECVADILALREQDDSAWPEPEPAPDDGRFRVLMVCTGNTSRSAIAHAAGKAAAPPGVLVGSAGTYARSGSPASGKATAAATELGLDLSAHRSRELSPGMLVAADEVWHMTERHAREILAVAPWAAPKLRRLDPNSDIADPHGGSAELYGETAEKVVRAVRTRMAALRLDAARAALRAAPFHRVAGMLGGAP